MKLFKTESDSFTILLKEENREIIGSFCEQIISYYDTYSIVFEKIELKINFSIGIAPVIEDINPIVDAEYALECSKEIGGRYYTFYDDSLESL